MHGRILVLDDEENYAEMLQKLLQQHRFVVDSSTRPQDALVLLEEKEYALVVTDYKMPVMDGADFLQRARKIKANLPVIIVSGLMNTPELVKVANMAVTLVLEKPLDIDSFIGHVSSFVAPLSEEEWANLEGVPSSAKKEAQVATSYPRPLVHFSDACEASQLFVDSLYGESKNTQQIFIQASSGCEFELIAREVGVWKNAPERRSYFFSATEFLEPAVQERLKELDGADPFSPVVVVGRMDELDETQQAQMLTFIQSGQASLPHTAALTFLYFTSKVEGVLCDDLANYYRDAGLYLAPLSERLPDLAIYVLRYLALYAEREDKKEAAHLSRDAMACLLQHSWKGDFLELVNTLRRTVAVGPNEVTTAERVAAILNRQGYTSVPTDPSLKAALLNSQQALVSSERFATVDDPASVYAQLDIPVDKIDSAKKPQEQPLLYPEILKNS